MINVGGNKVHPQNVERVIRAVPGVADARVYGQPSSIAGQLVACDIVPAAGCDPDELRQNVLAHCAQSLTSYERPRVIQTVPVIETTSAGKTRR